ncbi:MAG: OPT/YSL family transporter [Planctomycetes bacterium]|nr:OPT/YSL family transporter [Planctomycetota bacterium]
MENAPPTIEPSVKPAHVRELTPRSVIAALLVAAVIGASYPYVVLKLGFGPNISVVSAFFGFLALGLFSRSYNRWENNIVQTAGTAAGQIAFLCWLLAAFDMLAADKSTGFQVHLTTWQTFLWFSTAGILGVFLAVPLRKHFIEDEKLAFPDGLAAAETLVLLDSKGGQAKLSAYSMLGALAASAAVMWATTRAWVDELFHVTFNRFSGVTGVGFSLSLLNIGSGMIIGLRICASMLFGLVLSWIVAPVLLADTGVIAEGSKKVDVLLWVMWPATGLLVAGGLTALALKWKTLVATFRSLAGASVQTGDFPLRWVITGSLVSAAALVAIQYSILGTPVWQSLLAIVLSIPLMLVAMRVLGETNWGPISTMTNVMQAMFGAISPGDMRATVVSSGITGSVAAESEGLMQDYKTGHVIGSTPRMLTWMQLFAVPVGCLALAFAYPLLRDTYGVGEGKLSSPISVRWVGFAKILSQGFSSIHPSALWGLAIGAALGIVLTVVEQKKELRNFVPSPTGVGIGMLVPASAVATMFLGACLDWIWRKSDATSAQKYSIPVASGFIAGEALIAVLIPVLVVLGWMSI